MLGESRNELESAFYMQSTKNEMELLSSPLLTNVFAKRVNLSFEPFTAMVFDTLPQPFHVTCILAKYLLCHDQRFKVKIIYTNLYFSLS